MKTPPAYIFVENVKGFEDSATHDIFIQHLQDSGYIYQEFLLTPLQFGIPNSRLRYYCMAKRKQMGEFVFSTVDTVIRLTAHKICDFFSGLNNILGIASTEWLERSPLTLKIPGSRQSF